MAFLPGPHSCVVAAVSRLSSSSIQQPDFGDLFLSFSVEFWIQLGTMHDREIVNPGQSLLAGEVVRMSQMTNQIHFEKRSP